MRRRQFVKAGCAAAMAGLFAPRAHASSALVRDPDGIVDLPEGFSYRILSRAGTAMTDGYVHPGRPDGMGCFPLGDQLVLMRNHEIFQTDNRSGAYGPDNVPPEAHDPEAFGGVTRLVVDGTSGELVSSNLVLTGTYWNCAGGLSPWGWLSCEETVSPGHGHVFLCATDTAGVAKARPIKAYGRFRHEAATVHPRTLVAYLTEDEPDSCFYRFVPHAKDKPFEGKLQAMVVDGKRTFDTARLGDDQKLPVRWIDVVESEGTPLRHVALKAGAARVARGEGLWLDGDLVYFASTSGGPVGRGQIFCLDEGNDQPTLRVVAQASDPAHLDMPDNITVAPSGNLYLAEDGLGQNYIRHLTPDGTLTEFARNANSTSEFAGLCFSPDGQHLFANLQTDGLTMVIDGPFDQATADGRPPGKPPDAEPTSLPGKAGLAAGAAIIALAALRGRKK